METALPQKNRLDWSKLVDYRPARVSDLDAIMAIENQSFPTPTRRETYEQEMDFEFYLKRVAELKQGSTIAGYAFCVMTPPEASINTLAVRKDLRNQGLASYFMGRILDDLRDLKVHQAWLQARVNNLAALALYSRLGFERIGVRPKYYPDTGEDAVLLKKEWP